MTKQELRNVATIAALRGVSSLSGHRMYWVWGTAQIFFYDKTSMAVDDGVSVVKPTSVNIANPGRWLLNIGGSGETPGGAATGDLAGSYPNPTVAAIHETSGPTKLTIGTVADTQLLKRSGSTLVSVAPAGVDTTAVHSGDGAGGDLAGTYPSPTVAALAITDAKVAAANKDGTAGTASMRTLGTGAAQAAAGNDARFGETLRFNFPGVLNINENAYIPVVPLDRAVTITKLAAFVKTPSTGADIIVTFKKMTLSTGALSASIGTVTITAGTNTASTVVSVALATTEALVMEITQVGSVSTEGQNLTGWGIAA